ncbi:addiction module antidote protein [Caenimonas sp. SL110]|uniref:addiction module antidote protein n=1 Tax=Caenimonas sp. SL110 TaxID=1450524 RepID=UPI0009E4D7B9
MPRKEKSIDLAPFDAAEYLTDEAMVAEFLNESFAMNDPAVTLNALNTVARARGMTQLAAAAGVGRENLYNALKPGAKPRFETVMKLMDAMGLQFHAEVKASMTTRAKAPAPVIRRKSEVPKVVHPRRNRVKTKSAVTTGSAKVERAAPMARAEKKT